MHRTKKCAYAQDVRAEIGRLEGLGIANREAHSIIIEREKEKKEKK